MDEQQSLRLLACRYVDEIERLLELPSIHALETARRFANGKATAEELAEAGRLAADNALDIATHRSGGGAQHAAEAAYATTNANAHEASRLALDYAAKALASSRTNPGRTDDEFAAEMKKQQERLKQIKL